MCQHERIRVFACEGVLVCGKHVHLYMGVFLSPYVHLLRNWMTDFLIDPVHTNNGARPLPHAHTLMHSNLHFQFSIGAGVSITQAYVPFTLKAQLYQEGYIET